jgi:protein-tyrosine-phosphatase
LVNEQHPCPVHFEATFSVQKIGFSGQAAMVGYPADDMTVEVAASNGLDLSAHRSQPVQS